MFYVHRLSISQFERKELLQPQIRNGVQHIVRVILYSEVWDLVNHYHYCRRGIDASFVDMWAVKLVVVSSHIISILPNNNQCKTSSLVKG